MLRFDLRHRRQKKGLSIRALSEESEVNRGTLSILETDRMWKSLSAASKVIGEPIGLTATGRVTIMVDEMHKPEDYPKCDHLKSCPSCGYWLCTDLWMDVAPDDCRKCKEES